MGGERAVQVARDHTAEIEAKLAHERALAVAMRKAIRLKAIEELEEEKYRIARARAEADAVVAHKDVVRCYCSTPGAGAAGHNKFICNNGEVRHCASNEVCYAPHEFRWGSWHDGCHVADDVDFLGAEGRKSEYNVDYWGADLSEFHALVQQGEDQGVKHKFCIDGHCF